jgi:hypothetical protein
VAGPSDDLRGEVALRVGRQRALAALERRALTDADLVELTAATLEAIVVHLPAEHAGAFTVDPGGLTAVALTTQAPSRPAPSP